MTTTKTLPTHAEAKTAFDSCLKAFADSAPINEADMQTAFAGIANGIQIRDYALGACGLSLSASDSVTFLNLFKAIAGESAHVEAVKGAYAYEAGDLKSAKEFLDSAHVLDPKNSLASLLIRVMSSGWPAGAFVSMREELHPKVTAGVEDLSGVIVGEESKTA